MYDNPRLTIGAPSLYELRQRNSTGLMEALLPGQDNPNPPALPGSGPQTPQDVPAWWADGKRVGRFVLDLYDTDPEGAKAFWAMYRRALA